MPRKGEHAGTFIVWHRFSRRGELFAAEFDLTLHLITSLRRSRLSAPIRYVLQTGRTLATLFRERPAVVIVQTPPVFAALAVYAYCALRGVSFVIDAHTSALVTESFRWLLPLQAFLCRRAGGTIVTNNHLQQLVERWGGRALTVPDIPLDLPDGTPFSTRGPSIAVVASFSPDEPMDEISQAAAAVPSVRFLVTGDPARADREWVENRPSNVELLEFVPDDEYLGLLRAVDGVLVLTRRDHTMQRGACEALAVGTPVITSDTPLLREFFRGGTIHVDNTAAAIAAAVRTVCEEGARLRAEMRLLKSEYREAWPRTRQEILDLLASP